jgi:site-specific DNA recombinase
MKVIIYCRVSTVRQVREGASLEDQRRACLEYCKANNHEMVHIFMEEGESATTLDRTELTKLTNFCQMNRGKVEAMVVYAVDRVSRDTLDYKILKALLGKYGVSIRSVTQTAVDDSPEGGLMEHLLSGFSEYENKQRTRRTVTGMKGKIERGGWPFKAPLGYRNVTSEQDKRVMVLDAERAPLVRQALEMFTTGLHKKQQVLAYINKLGLRTRTGKPVPAQTFDRMLRNPLYAGLLRVEGKRVSDWTESDSAAFEAIISREVFGKIQDVLSGKKASLTPRKRSNPAFPLRHFVRCASCDKPLTASFSKGRNGKHPYYHCQNKRCSARKSFKRVEVESRFVEFLRTLQPKPEL